MSITSCDFCSGEHANLTCSRCRCVYYCSQSCQKKDWKEHKERCTKGDLYFDRFRAKEAEIASYLEVLADTTNRECAICLEKIREKPLALPCQHVFCEICLVEHQLRHDSSSLFCPLCRKELPGGLFKYINDNATFFMHMVERDPDQREHFCKQARRELNILTAYRVNTRALNAELLCLEGKYQEAMSASLAILEEKQDPTYTAPIYTIINANMGLKDYKTAMQCIREFKKLPNRSWDDKFFSNNKGSECSYHLGSYRESVVLGKLVLKSNRHNPGVHKWIALSKKALGQLDEALLTMRRAVRYETPWNSLHTQRCQDLLDQLLSEQKMQQQTEEGSTENETK